MTGRALPPGEYWYEDLQEGDCFTTGSLVMTDSHIVNFAGLSGDFFDLHMDDNFAREQGFPARVAHGILGLALADGLKNRSPVRIMSIAALGWNWAFRAPLFTEDRITVNVFVIQKRPTKRGDRGIVTLRLEVTNQDGSTVQEGETFLLIRRRPHTVEFQANG